MVYNNYIPFYSITCPVIELAEVGASAFLFAEALTTTHFQNGVFLWVFLK